MENTFFDPELLEHFQRRAAGLPPVPVKQPGISHAAQLTALFACRRKRPSEEPAIPLHRGPRGGRYYIRTKDDGTLRRDYV